MRKLFLKYRTVLFALPFFFLASEGFSQGTYKSEYGYSISVSSYWKDMPADIFSNLSKYVGKRFAQGKLEKAFIREGTDTLSMPFIIIQMLGSNNDEMYNAVIEAGESMFKDKPGEINGTGDKNKILDKEENSFFTNAAKKIVYLKMTSKGPTGQEITSLSAMMLNGTYGIQLNFMSKSEDFRFDIDRYLEIIDSFQYEK